MVQKTGESVTDGEEEEEQEDREPRERGAR